MATISIEKLTDYFYRFPGIGKKSASRLAFHILEMDQSEINEFVKAIYEVKEKTQKCTICGNLSESEICEICSSESRESSIICVVEDNRDIIALEKSKSYSGKYHVLNGKIAPLSGITPDKLNIKSLLQRVASEDISEIILALNPDLEGETTAMYLMKLIKPFGVKITKIASGIPMGGNIEFSDIATINRALNDRKE
ncbi:MAG: recombination protein RecR, partial [Psychrilyobacter sp.]|nr:recombination protein RecR [Psychrilyobacter sp.]